MNHLPLCDADADRLMSAIRTWGSEVRRETRYLHQGNMEQHLFHAGKADATYLDIIKMVRGDYAELVRNEPPDSYAAELTQRTAIPKP